MLKKRLSPVDSLFFVFEFTQIRLIKLNDFNFTYYYHTFARFYTSFLRENVKKWLF
jgi:hypothetical protein